MAKPKFYQSKLTLVKGNVFDHVYNGLFKTMTLKERMGSENAECTECGGNEWMILPDESCAVREGGKAYVECLGCGAMTHL